MEQAQELTALLSADNSKRVPGKPFVKNDPRINRDGRPPGSVSIVAEIKKKLEEVPEGSKDTYLKIFVFRLMQKAIIDGDTTIMKDIIDRVDGRAKQSIGLDINDGDEERTALKDLIAKINGESRETGDSKDDSEGVLQE